MNLLAIDVGGTEIKYACLNERYEMNKWGKIATPQNSLDDFVASIKNIYEQFKNEVSGVALALPGFIDTERGFVFHGGSLTYNNGIYLEKLLSEQLNCPVKLENDAKAAAMAELANGVLKNCRDAAVFIIGTGIGGGIIVDGKLVKGRNFTAGEFSYLNVNIKEAQFQETFYGGMVHYCSTPALLRMYRENSGKDEEIDGITFFERFNNNDEAAIKTLNQFTYNLALQTMNLGVLLNCEKIAIGGGISRQKILVEMINEKIKDLQVNKMLEENGVKNPFIPEIVNCYYSADANLIGAVYSYLQQIGEKR